MPQPLYRRTEAIRAYGDGKAVAVTCDGAMPEIAVAPPETMMSEGKAWGLLSGLRWPVVFLQIDFISHDFLALSFSN